MGLSGDEARATGAAGSGQVRWDRSPLGAGEPFPKHISCEPHRIILWVGEKEREMATGRSSQARLPASAWRFGKKLFGDLFSPEERLPTVLYEVSFRFIMVKCSQAGCSRAAARLCKRAKNRSFCKAHCLELVGPATGLCPFHAPAAPAPAAAARRAQVAPAPPASSEGEDSGDESSDVSVADVAEVAASAAGPPLVAVSADTAAAARFLDTLSSVLERATAVVGQKRRRDPDSESDAEEEADRKVAAITKDEARRGFQRKLRMSRDELASLDVAEVLFCENLWEKWVSASADPAARAARRSTLIQAIAASLGTSVPPPASRPPAPAGLGRLLVELVDALLAPEEAFGPPPAKPPVSLRQRLTTLLGLRVRFAALEKQASRDTAMAWWATVGPWQASAPPEDAAFLAAWHKKAAAKGVGGSSVAGSGTTGGRPPLGEGMGQGRGRARARRQTRSRGKTGGGQAGHPQRRTQSARPAGKPRGQGGGPAAVTDSRFERLLAALKEK